MTQIGATLKGQTPFAGVPVAAIVGAAALAAVMGSTSATFGALAFYALAGCALAMTTWLAVQGMPVTENRISVDVPKHRNRRLREPST